MDNPLILFAHLVLEQPKVFRRDDLAVLFYPDSDDLRAKQNLRQVIHRLRRLLHEEASPVPLLLIDALTIQLNPEANFWCDVNAFQQIYTSIKKHPHRRLGICHNCMEKLQEEVRLYQGDFLRGYGMRVDGLLGEWVNAVRNDLKNKTTWMLSQLAEFNFNHRQLDLCQENIDHLFAIDPYDEQNLRLEMQLNWLTGHRNKSLKKYFNFRKQLLDDLNLQPEMETTRLAQKIRLIENPSDGPGADGLKFPLVRRPILGDELPVSHNRFCGYQKELELISEFLDCHDNQLITLKGGLGAGKTRLALEAASRKIDDWTDGVYYVSLRKSQHKYGDLKEALVTSLGIPSHNLVDHRRNIIKHLCGKEMLIILDDGDYFASQIELIQNIISTFSAIKIIVTARRYLNVRGQKLINIHGLEYPPESEINMDALDIASETIFEKYSSSRLFFECARNEKPSFQPSAEDIRYINACCTITTGVPLLIENLALYVRLLSCKQIYEDLYRVIHQLTGTELYKRRYSYIWKVFEATWDSLTAHEQFVLTRIYQNPDGVSLDDLMKQEDIIPDVVFDLQERSKLIHVAGDRLIPHPIMRMMVAAR